MKRDDDGAKAMLILMLAGGILGGALAATGTFLAGCGIWWSLLAYSLGGMATILIVAGAAITRPFADGTDHGRPD